MCARVDAACAHIYIYMYMCENTGAQKKIDRDIALVSMHDRK